MTPFIYLKFFEVMQIIAPFSINKIKNNKNDEDNYSDNS